MPKRRTAGSILLTTWIACGFATAQWAPPAIEAPRLQRHVFASRAAGTDVACHVCTPEVYDAAPQRRFPVVYWLHGRGGGQPGMVARLVEHFDLATRRGEIPPLIVVVPNGMTESLWVDSKDGTVPMETVVVEELIPSIDGAFRTIAAREGRMVEGFSMGGYGAARLGLKYPELFCASSMLGAGPLQREFGVSGSGEMADVRRRVFQTVFGGDQEYYRVQSPWTLAEKRAGAARARTLMRMVIGGRDSLLRFNREFHARLDQLGIPHSFQIVPDVGHHPIALFDALGDDNGTFYRRAFENVAPAETAAPAPKTYLLVIGKGRAADPAKQQERAATAVRKVVDAARRLDPDIGVDALAENVMTKEEFRRREKQIRVTGEIVKRRLRQLAETATPRDTVIIYTHSHGTRDGLDESRPPGGIVLDRGSPREGKRGVLTWGEYADLFLDIPAKNVVVLTMSCFSGGLVEHLNSPRVKARWAERRREGRNLVVLTSQDKDTMSPPIVKDRELINPFTYAVVGMFEGKADGFGLAGSLTSREDKLTEKRQKDGRLTLGEMIDYVLHTTEHTPSEWSQRENIAKPQVTGSYDPEATLLPTPIPFAGGS